MAEPSDPSAPLSPGPEADRYGQLCAMHRWQVPPDFSIPQACLRRWADGSGRIAIRVDHGTGPVECFDFDTLQRDADALAASLLRLGVAPGARVAYILPQGPTTLITQMAILQCGAIAMPLSMLFGPEALQQRLEDSGACAVACAAEKADTLREIAAACPALTALIIDAGSIDEGGSEGGGRGGGEGGGEDGSPPREHRLAALLQTPATGYRPAPGNANAPAYLIYTSGTTGAPKGALIPHRALLGNLSGFVLSQNDYPQEGDVFWSPADWAWTGGLMDALLPSLYFGRPIVATSGRFDPLGAFALMERHGVTNTFLFPTALKQMMKAVSRPRDVYKLKLRAVMSAGEAVGQAVFHWCREALGVRVNEMFGQTEINYLVGNSAAWPAKPGSIGRPYPGHRIALIDEDGQPCATGEIGEVAAHVNDLHGDPDPVFFLGYWNNDAATRAKYGGPDGQWCRTGDLAKADADGDLWYQGRADDMFKAAGYRIGPGEIENCLVTHPAVANAAVVPSPDAERGNLVKAYVVLTPGSVGDAALVRALQDHVRGRLAPYEYPKEIEFIEALPMTTTGKVQRRVLRHLEEERKRRPG